MSFLTSTRLLIPRSFSHQSSRITNPIKRSISTLQNNPCNPNIYVFPNNKGQRNYILTLLPTQPPTPSLALGTTTSLDTTTNPSAFTENSEFLPILQEVLKEYAWRDEGVKAQAKAFASMGGSALGSGGMFFPQQRQHRKGSMGNSRSGDGAGGASSQGGAGGAGRGGWIHLSDMRAPPDYGRIAWPEDIFGSLEVDGVGELVGEMGGYQGSGSYRVCTKEGILGLSEYLNGKVVERLLELERGMK